MLPDEREMLDFVHITLRETELHSANSENAFYFRDRYLHTLRVLGWVRRLGATESFDMRLASIAAIFHDVGFDHRYKSEHAAMGAQICRKYLTEHGFDHGDVELITDMVRLHSDKTLPKQQLSYELQALMDADILDELGVTICLWDALDEGYKHRGGYYEVLKRVKTAYAKLSGYLPTMRTDTGRIEYQKGLEAMKFAIDRLEYELQTDFIDENTLNSIATTDMT